MNQKNSRYIFIFLLLMVLPALACGFGSDDEAGPPRNAIVVNVMANSSLEPWLTTLVADFNATEQETADGHPIYVQLAAAESGQAVLDLTADSSEFSLWIPESDVWVEILADSGVQD